MFDRLLLIIAKSRSIAMAIGLSLVLIISSMPSAWAFCGFYVGGADAKLFNRASQVIIARENNNTILTMANDFQGNVKDFAMVVPVPVAIKKEQVHVGTKTTIDKLDKFSQPRLVEYTDNDPCYIPRPMSQMENITPPPAPAPSTAKRDNLGVTVEDKFKVNEYEIAILSAKESNGLETWLRRSGYNIPRGAAPLLQPYIKQQMKFFVAKVDLKEFKAANTEFLRPLQIAYTSPKFMLPIRLGMINSRGEQDLIIYVLSTQGRAEVSNYRTVKVPTNAEIPEYIQSQFGKFYQAVFQRSYERENKKVAFLEYAWDVSNCDPCSTEPPTPEELKAAGVFWQKPDRFDRNTFISRIHVRYNRNQFPEDLVFQQTSNRENFQGRYVIRHPFKGKITCNAGKQYARQVQNRQNNEIKALANLTGWNINDIRRQIKSPPVKDVNNNFWRSVW
jgi:hypothetical protein